MVGSGDPPCLRASTTSGLVPYMRTVKTTPGATAVQVVWSSRRGSREIEHLGRRMTRRR
jgi:hypothetical protein